MIDIETGNFEQADETMTATQKLLDRLWCKRSYQYPDSQPWVVRIGHQAVHRFGLESIRYTRSKLITPNNL